MSERAHRKYEIAEKSHRARSLWKGLFAGLIAGVAATAAKSVAERVYPPRIHGEPEPTEVLAEKLVGHELAPASRRSAGKAVTWGIGAAAGATYGAIAEYFPEATHREGASFGLALMALTHENVLSVRGAASETDQETTREHTSEAASHIIFGCVAERVRRLVRALL
ncbi:DUF1440 domain-containing protein [Granulicella sp. 5B5]|uniref:DUF1440 domain-containing protein n=1 Tax=Granulicella sp. 5B5 TaxID=1617967 RepID=UPI0015F54413|nr:DUF1440 domain-containing protein [Granulicella sp. 5B5]QMV19302.1 DUF1440 domain-containing protein [Granulicella sp. 5B5]